MRSCTAMAGSVGCVGCTRKRQFPGLCLPFRVLAIPHQIPQLWSSTVLLLPRPTPASDSSTKPPAEATKLFAPSHHRVPVQVYTRPQARPCPPLRCLPSTCPPPHAPAYARPRLRTGRRPCMRQDGEFDGEVKCDAHCTRHVFCRCRCHVSPPCLASADRRCGAASEYRECLKRVGLAIYLWPNVSERAERPIDGWWYGL